MQDQVRSQYEQYPYPQRNAREDEAMLGSLSPLESIPVLSHHGYGGGLDPRRPLRILVAGGGTGDASLLLGSELRRRGTGGEVVYVDLSQASMEIARFRAERAGLDNVTFVRGSYLELEAMGLGGFDYINCSGSLHHLEDPAAGVKALGKALTDDGVLGAMVYGRLGRTGVYAAQQLLQTLCGERPLSEQLPIARGLLSRLPASNWLNKNGGLRYYEGLSDPEVVDRFLHAQDQAYTITEVAELMSGADLRIVDVVPPLLYVPENYVSDPVARKRLSELPALQRWQVAEWLTGTISRHSWFAVRAANPVEPATLTQDMVPRFLVHSGPAIAEHIRVTGSVQLKVGNLTVSRPFDLPSPLYEALRLVDGRRSLGKIHRRVKPPMPWPVFRGAFEALYRYYHGASMLVLSRGVPCRV